MKKKQKIKNSTLISQKAAFKPLDRRYDVETSDRIDAKILDTFNYEYPGKDIIINIETDEFTAVCPWSGLPDFGVVKVNYVPDRKIIELRSFKYYLLSFRNVGIYQEHAVNMILQNLVKCCSPKWIQVVLDYSIRGGVHTVTSVEYGRKK